MLQDTRSLLQCPASVLLSLSLSLDPLALFVTSLVFSAATDLHLIPRAGFVEKSEIGDEVILLQNYFPVLTKYDLTN